MMPWFERHQKSCWNLKHRIRVGEIQSWIYLNLSTSRDGCVQFDEMVKISTEGLEYSHEIGLTLSPVVPSKICYQDTLSSTPLGCDVPYRIRYDGHRIVPSLVEWQLDFRVCWHPLQPGIPLWVGTERLFSIEELKIFLLLLVYFHLPSSPTSSSMMGIEWIMWLPKSLTESSHFPSFMMFFFHFFQKETWNDRRTQIDECFRPVIAMVSGGVPNTGGRHCSTVFPSSLRRQGWLAQRWHEYCWSGETGIPKYISLYIIDDDNW